MINILIIDDNSSRAGRITNHLCSKIGIPDSNIAACGTIRDALMHLEARYVDLLILDVQIPHRYGDGASARGAFDLLDKLKTNERLYVPTYVIGISAFVESQREWQEGHASFWDLIECPIEAEETWLSAIENKVRSLASLSNHVGRIDFNYKFDLGIICALPELELPAILDLPCNWTKKATKGLSTKFYFGHIEDGRRKLSIVAACTNEMGAAASASLTTEMIVNFRPKFVCNAGITAGIKGQAKIGDILFPNISWDHQSGKVVAADGQPKFLPDPRQIRVHQEMEDWAREFRSQRGLFEQIAKSWQGQQLNYGVPELKIGPVASGNVVVADQQFVDDIVGVQRKVIGIEMECYGLFYAARQFQHYGPVAFAMKSVSDAGDAEKSDHYQQYAAHVSARAVYEFAKLHLGE